MYIVFAYKILLKKIYLTLGTIPNNTNRETHT